jgi:hypothetical protein
MFWNSDSNHWFWTLVLPLIIEFPLSFVFFSANWASSLWRFLAYAGFCILVDVVALVIYGHVRRSSSDDAGPHSTPTG